MLHLKKLIKEFQESQEGTVFIMVALSSLMLIAAAGASVDMARQQTLQQKLSSSLDAAGLAAGATANTVNPETQATRYFNANFANGYLGASAITPTTTCKDMNKNTVTCGTPSTYTITVTASTNQATSFMKAAGINTVSVGATSEITRATSGLELALVLDNTGSMDNAVNSSNSSATKIDALKCAIVGSTAHLTSSNSTNCTSENLVTTGLLDILYGPSSSLTDLFISVVPFSDMVNVTTTETPGSSFVSNPTDSGLGGCVDSRGFTTNSVADTNTALGTTLPNHEVVTMDISDDAPSSSVSGTYFKALTSNNNSDCPSAVQPMTTSKDNIVSAVNAMDTGGNTEIQLGMAWGWRTLSPNWLGLWGSSPTYTYPDTSPAQVVSLPLPYHTQKMQKIVILMTDGENTVPTTHSKNNAYETQTSYPTTTTQLDNQTKTICDAMKSQGITIYTIGFGTSSNVNFTLLKYCSSTPTLNCGSTGSYCFSAATNSALSSAFQQIGDVLANLRVSQ